MEDREFYNCLVVRSICSLRGLDPLSPLVTPWSFCPEKVVDYEHHAVPSAVRSVECLGDMASEIIEI